MTKGPFCDHTADGGQGNHSFPPYRKTFLSQPRGKQADKATNHSLHSCHLIRTTDNKDIVVQWNERDRQSINNKPRTKE